jgi:hypothetical protein
VHPENAGHAIVAWKSPIEGTVRIAGSLRDADTTCGNGIAWSVEVGDTLLTSGTLANSEIELDAASLDVVSVEEGDMLYLVVTANGDHSCDTTSVDFKVIEQL